MVRAIFRQKGDRFFFEVSAEDGEAAGLKDGQEILLDIKPSTQSELSDEEFIKMADRIIDKNRDALEYLRDH